MTTNVEVFLNDLDGGTFEQKISRALSSVALGVVDNGKVGEVTIKFKIKQVAKGNHVNISHSLEFKKPTMNGMQGEINTTETPMHVGSEGSISLFPENQTQMFGKKGEVETV